MSSTSLSKSEDIFPGFKQLAPSVWHRPLQQSGATNGTVQGAHLDLVVLATWMGAAPKHIQKYVIHYRARYPSSPILLLTSTVADILLRTQNYHKQSRLEAIRVLHEMTKIRSDPKILLHLWSNGGAHHITHLAVMYRQMYNTPLPITGTVLDSAPGRATYGRSVAALSMGLPRFFLLRFLGLCVIHLMCCMMYINHHILGRENPITTVRKQLLDPKLFPLGPRCYIYSKSDSMVGWVDVEVAAEGAREKGWTVELERFEGTKHVAHMGKEPEKYWNAVDKVVRELG